jgi:Tfp pilus assembly protein FimT
LRKAFSIIELLIVVLFLGIATYIAITRMKISVIDRYKSETLAQRIVSDLRLARNMAITDASRNTSGIAVQMEGSPPYQGYKIINLSDGQTVSQFTIDNKISCSGGTQFKFGPLGNLLTGSDNQLLVSSGGKTSTINIISATGAVECIEN